MWVPSHMSQKPVFILLQILAEQSSIWLEKKRNKNKKKEKINSRGELEFWESLDRYL